MTGPRDVVAGVSLLRRLPTFLRNPVTTMEARATLRRRLERREDDFLSLLRSSVYPNRIGPYRRLLDYAGIEDGDAERLVRREGVEGALHVLQREGVYLTLDEFKGRRPVRRGSLALTLTPDALRNLRASVHVFFHTSGRTGPSQVVGIDLAQIRHEGADLRLFFAARGGDRWVHGVYGVPGSSIVRVVMRIGSIGAPLVRWFSQLDPAASELDSRYRWSARMMRVGGALARVPIPAPVHVPLEHPRPIVSWLTDVLARGETPHLWSSPSSAVRVCEAASAAGACLRGAQFTLVGEPLTAARLAAIRRGGAEASSYYGSMETGHVAYSCLAPGPADDMHLIHDLYAVVQPLDWTGARPLPPEPDVAADALFVSTIGPAAPFVMLNVSLGDRGIIEDRHCGCALEALGWRKHLHTIRGHEKVTAGGLTLDDADVARVLEEVLPSRFGGVPTHYQLVEDEDEHGHPRLKLLVHPALGEINTEAVIEAFLDAVGPGTGPARVVELAWRAGRFLQVERTPPRVTGGGKILHLLDARHPRSR